MTAREPAEVRAENAQDRRVAREVNRAFAVVNAEPAGTLSTAATVHVVFSSGEPCPCSCSTVCGCDTGGAA